MVTKKNPAGRSSPAPSSASAKAAQRAAQPSAAATPKGGQAGKGKPKRATSGGGSAAQAGFSFQNQAAAFVAACLLAEEPVTWFDLGEEGVPIRVGLETGAPVDDVMATTELGGRCFINAKTSVQVSDRSTGALASAFHQFVRIMIEARKGGDSEWQAPLDAAKDRLILVCERTGSGPLSRSANLFKRIAARPKGTARGKVANTQDDKRLLKVVEKLVGRSWKAETGQRPTTAEVDELLSLVRAVALDAPHDLKGGSTAFLRAVVQDHTKAAAAWTSLVRHCTELAEHRGVVDRSGLVEALRKNGVHVGHSARMAEDVRVLERETATTLQRLERSAILRGAPDAGIPATTLKRACVDALVQHARTGSFLVTGSAGAGKSGALYLAALALQREGHPVIVLAVDRFGVSSIHELRLELGLQNQIVDVLRAWSSEKPGVLLIDAMDATRGDAAERTFRELATAVRSSLPNWHVVASVRSFDLRYGFELRDAFRGKPLAPPFSEAEFGDVAHLHVPRLSDDELASLKDSSPPLWRAYERASPHLKDVLRSPYNLHLLGEILGSEGQEADLSTIETEVQLLDRHWERRVTANDGRVHRDDRVELLRRVTASMVSERRLSLRRRTVVERDDRLACDELLSRGVLAANVTAGRKGTDDIAFAHHALFDYAVASLTLERGEAPDLLSRLTASDDTFFWLAPGALIALRMLWAADADHSRFWRLALALRSAEGLGGFYRSLPARVAAELATDLGDFAPVMACIATAGSSDKSAAEALVKAVVSDVLAGVSDGARAIGEGAGPWCALVRCLSETDPTEFAWPGFGAIRIWTNEPDVMTVAQKDDLAAAARVLLQTGLATGRDGDQQIGSAVQALVRTLPVAREANLDVLRALLLPERVSSHGHRDLFWVSQEHGRLKELAPEYLGEVYRRAFLTALPERGVERQIGDSRIMALLSDTRQDMQLVRHTLLEAFPGFLVASPKVAAAALVDILDSQVGRRRWADPAAAINLASAGLEARVVPDGSHFWWSPSGHRRGSDADAALLAGLVQGLSNLLDAGATDEIRAVFEVLARSGWAAFWSALMTSAKRWPPELVVLLLPVLTNEKALAMPELWHAAGELLRELHPSLGSDDRARCERAILSISKEIPRLRLLACIEESSLVLEESRAALAAARLAGPLPQNVPAFSMSIHAGPLDPDARYRDAGIDPSLPDHAVMLSAIHDLRQEMGEAQNTGKEGDEAVLTLDRAEEVWLRAKRLRGLVTEHAQAAELLRQEAWQYIGEALRQVAEVCSEPQDLARMDGALDVLRELISPAEALGPDPQPDEGREARFAEGRSWTYPAPRAEGTLALLLLLRSFRGPRPEELLRNASVLARDASPEVRTNLVGNLHLLASQAPETMWDIFTERMRHEPNRAVLASMCVSLCHVMPLDPARAAALVMPLAQREASEPQEQPDELGETVAAAMVQAWIGHGIASADEWFRSLMDDPRARCGLIRACVPHMRSGVAPREETAESEEAAVEQRRWAAAVRSRTAAFMMIATQRALQLLNEADRAEDHQGAQAAMQILDTVASEIRFGATSEEGGERGQSPAPTLQRRATASQFFAEFRPVLDVLGSVGHPAITHHLLEAMAPLISVAPDHVFGVLRAAFESGGMRGYQFESLGADLLIKMVRTFLADHRDVLAGTLESRRAVAGMLGFFAEAGWPEARKLAYDLPSLLR